MPNFPRRAVLLAPVLLALLPLALPSPAFAHAILEESVPVTGASIEAGTIAMRYRFNTRIDHARSRLTLIHPDHTRVELPVTPGTSPDILATTAALTQGAYVLRWQVLAIDGHITRGDVSFTVTGQ